MLQKLRLEHGRPRTHGLLTAEVIYPLVDYYFDHLYTTVPILHRYRVQDRIEKKDSSGEAYCELAALCAFVLTQQSMAVRAEAGMKQLARRLREEAISVREGHYLIDGPTLGSVYTSFLLYECFSRSDDPYGDAAWYYLRQAADLAVIIMPTHELSTYDERLCWSLLMAQK